MSNEIVLCVKLKVQRGFPILSPHALENALTKSTLSFLAQYLKKDKQPPPVFRVDRPHPEQDITEITVRYEQQRTK